MRFSDIRERFRRVREGQTSVEEGVVIRWIAPTEGEMRIYAQRGGNASSFGRELVAEAITGWSGPKVMHIYPDDQTIAEEPLEFSPDAAQALLDVQVSWMDRLTLDIMAAYQRRLEQVEGERKQPETASTGN
jgi:hypothetical protein